jgi:hypothetical protein
VCTLNARLTSRGATKFSLAPIRGWIGLGE